MNISLQEQIWSVVAAIPEGKVTTYGGVAKACGYPNHARYVGKVLSDLPSDSTLPWHRVVAAGGRIAFAAESDRARIQIEKLHAEGVTLLNGKVPMRHYQYSG